jgi:hypothetical protein
MRETRLQQGNISDIGDLHKKERRGILIQLGIVALLIMALSLLLLVVMGPLEKIPPSTFNRRTDGFYGLYRSLDELGLEVRRNQHSLPFLFSPKNPKKVDCLLLLDPQKAFLSFTKTKSLIPWIEKGGNLLISEEGLQPIRAKGVKLFYNKNDTILHNLFTAVPDLVWKALGKKIKGQGPLADFSGRIKKEKNLGNLLPGSAIPNQNEKTNLAIMGEAQGESKLGIKVFARAQDPWRTLAEYGGQPILLERTLGKGKLILCSTPLVFTNYACAKLGTGSLAVGVVLIASEGGHRTVVFDEWSHGLAHEKGVLAFLRNPRLLYPVLAVLLLYIVLIWRGSVREGPVSPKHELPRRSKEEFIFAQGQLLSKAKKYDHAALWLFEGYDRLLKRSTGMDDWPERQDILAKLEKIKPKDAAAFRSFGKILTQSYSKLTKAQEKVAKMSHQVESPRKG